jgi:hypothetical protein
MTEDEAKTKRCPVGAGNMAAIEGTPAIHMNIYTTKCIGSDCMAWRWGEPSISVKKVMEGEECPIENNNGYCGLAGKP